MTVAYISRIKRLNRKINYCNKFHNKIFEILSILAIATISLISLTWFRESDFLWSDDANFPLDIRVFINRYLYIWDSAQGSLDPGKFAFWVPIGVLLKAYEFLGLPFSPYIFQRGLVYILVLSSSLSMYFLSHTLLKERRNRHIAALIASLLYTFNLYSLVVIWGSLAFLMFQYAFLPLVLALYIRSIDDRRGFRYAVFVAIIWTVTMTPAYITSSLVLSDWMIVILYLGYSLLTTPNTKIKLHLSYFTLCMMGSWLLLNTFWLIPLLSSLNLIVIQKESISPPLHLFEANSVAVLDGFRLTGYWGLSSAYKGSRYFPWYNIYQTPLFIALSFVLPILAALSILINRRNKHVIFFGILLLLAVFLAKGPRPPLGEINLWLFNNMILLTAFRSLYQRFIGYAVLSYSFLIGSLISSQIEIFRRRCLLKHISIFIILFLLLAVLGPYTSPAWTGDFYSTEGIIPSKRITIPNYYWEAAEWINNQPDEFAILPLPFPIRGGIVLWWKNGTQGYSGIYPFLLLSSKFFLVSNKIGAFLATSIVNGSMRDAGMLSLFNIKYVVLHRDANEEYLNGHPSWISLPWQTAQLRLQSIPGLVLEKSFGNIDFYLNTYWAQKRISIIPQGDIEVLQQNPASYTIKISINQPSCLIFSEAFDQGWMLDIEGSKASNHFKANGYVNGWYLNSIGNQTIKIYHLSQQYFEVGKIISSVSFASVILILFASCLLRFRISFPVKHSSKSEQSDGI